MKVSPTACWISFSSTCIACRSFRSSAPEGLVEQQYFTRPHHERPGERDALALPARELGGLAIPEPAELDHLERLLGPDARSALGALRTINP